MYNLPCYYCLLGVFDVADLRSLISQLVVCQVGDDLGGELVGIGDRILAICGPI